MLCITSAVLLLSNDEAEDKVKSHLELMALTSSRRYHGTSVEEILIETEYTVDTKIKLTLRIHSYAAVTNEHSVICCHVQI